MGAVTLAAPWGTSPADHQDHRLSQHHHGLEDPSTEKRDHTHKDSSVHIAGMASVQSAFTYILSCVLPKAPWERHGQTRPV